MTQTFTDLDAAQREGREPIRCPRCGTVLALTEPDDPRFIRINGGARAEGRIRLVCDCGVKHEYRTSQTR